jgi:hypothetical protein
MGRRDGTGASRRKGEFRDYEDVPLWIWTNAKVIADPHRQFRNIVGTFKGYQKPVLIRKIKYRWHCCPVIKRIAAIG